MTYVRTTCCRVFRPPRPFHGGEGLIELLRGEPNLKLPQCEWPRTPELGVTSAWEGRARTFARISLKGRKPWNL